MSNNIQSVWSHCNDFSFNFSGLKGHVKDTVPDSTSPPTFRKGKRPFYLKCMQSRVRVPVSDVTGGFYLSGSSSDDTKTPFLLFFWNQVVKGEDGERSVTVDPYPEGETFDGATFQHFFYPTRARSFMDRGTTSS